MLWIALCLPDLSVQLALRGLQGNPALVVSEGPATRPRVRAVNDTAMQAGVRPGMPVAAAQALARELTIVTENPAQEAAALARLAAWASQFTPGVAIKSRAGLLLEVASTLRLFGGIRRLIGMLTTGSCELGYRAAIRVAPTPAGAWWMAKARARRIPARSCFEVDELRCCLGSLPLALLDWPEETVRLLHELAVETLDQFLALPRAGVALRFGAEPMASIERALGLQPDPQRYFVASETWRGEVEFPSEVEHTEALLFPLRRLLGELEGFLRARGAGIQEVVVGVMHSRRPPVSSAGSPQWNATARIHALLRERMRRVELPAPACGVLLKAGALLPFVPVNASLLPDRKVHTIELAHLHERLVARLGESRLQALAVVDDHRPERAFSSQVAGGKPTGDFPLRPVWLLAAPRPLAVHDEVPVLRGPLHLLAGPERIEAGWWDGAPMARDYFVAGNPQGEALWIYRELAAPGRWFVHGIFA